MLAIEARGLQKVYGTLIALEGLDLAVKEGELFALLGVNGAGKSTAIRLLSCLSRPTAGDAFVGGHSIQKDPAGVKNCIGVAPQETALAPNLTVKENLELLCGIYGLNRSQTRERIGELSEAFRLEQILQRRAGKLSGGWQRRVSIALALVGKPSVLFLDEPTLGLDVIGRRELWELIRSLKGKITVILTTHYMEEAEILSDRVGVLKDGKLLTVGTPRELMERTGTDRFEDAFLRMVKEGA
ncbi:MAG: ABC transporter ATP-binding protein [Oscillospiraceae bacterium]|nr:ABC transporter ATP-binding protein [Oscillospiraceae bacterium]